MAVVITPFPHQKIPILTPFSLNVSISGNPTDVSVEGRLKGFHYNWTGTRVELRGTPEIYAKNIEVTITADTAIYRGLLSIVPPPPIISPLSRVVVNRGVDISIPIPITGLVSQLVIDGPWIGLKYRQTETGGEMYGVIHADAEFTSRTFDYSITAYNQESFDTETLTIEIALGS